MLYLNSQIPKTCHLTYHRTSFGRFIYIHTPVRIWQPFWILATLDFQGSFLTSYLNPQPGKHVLTHYVYHLKAFYVGRKASNWDFDCGEIMGGGVTLCPLWAARGKKTLMKFMILNKEYMKEDIHLVCLDVTCLVWIEIGYFVLLGEKKEAIFCCF